ncbi:MAG: hypothetical protein K2M88_09155, partial [Muribaculaceae bacterium]|nr:hypothetical protein [Muribaculaceae bacterium]
MTTSITGKEISAPIWGGQRPAFLTTWSEIKKLGFKKRDRSFGHIIDENGKDVPALFFMAAKHCCWKNSVKLPPGRPNKLPPGKSFKLPPA